MAGITNIRSSAYVPQVAGAPRPTVQAGGGTQLAQMDADTISMGLRVSTPVAKIAYDHMGWLKNLIGKIFHHGSAPMPGPVPGPVPAEFMGGAGSAVGGALKTFGQALKSNFLVSAAMSVISDGIAFVTGKASARRTAASIGVDTVAYTGIGAAATTIGATLGTLIPIPFVGTLLGLAAGLGFGLLYEKVARKSAIDAAENAVFKTTT